jgi:ribosomal protein S18 acetylase RimI-like enzyme
MSERMRAPQGERPDPHADGGVIVRGAGVADLPGLAALEQAVFAPDAYPAFFFRQALDLWPAHLWVAAERDALCGYVLGGSAARAGEGWMLSLAVREDRRGQGFAVALVNTLLQSFTMRGYDRVVLTVTPSNTAAVRLYERLGFRVEADEAHYFGPGQRRWRMANVLG